jgi:acid phosphatase type 7
VKTVVRVNRNSWLILILNMVLGGLLLGWLFLLDGTYGFYKWVPYLSFIFYIPALPVLAVVARLIHRPSKILEIVSMISVVISLIIFAFVFGNSFKFSGSTLPILLVEDGSGANGVPNLALTFRTDKPSQNILEYGVGELTDQIAENKPVYQHVIKLKDLQPATRYQWRLNHGPVNSFVTPQLQEEIYHFGAAGDVHFGGKMNPRVTRNILSYAGKPENGFNTFFILGDLTEMGMNNDLWKKTWDTIAQYSYNVPLRPVMGNHDALFNGVPHYLAYLYPEGMETQNGTRLYYRIDAGKVHFIMLKLLWGSEDFRGQQKAWFEKQLADIPQDDWTIVMMHPMVYSSGYVDQGLPWYDPPEMIRDLAPLFEKYRVDLVLSGHNHLMEFLQKNGVSYGVIGTMGGPLDTVTHRSPASLWYDNQHFGFLDVTVSNEAIKLCFRDDGGGELKAFKLSQNKWLSN